MKEISRKNAHDIQFQIPQEQNINWLKNIASPFKIYNFLRNSIYKCGVERRGILITYISVWFNSFCLIKCLINS